MTQAATSIARAAFAAAIGSAGCHSHPTQTRTPEVTQVLVPVEATTDADDERRAAGFRCDEHAVGETTRVEFRVQNAARDGSTSVETRAVYTITTQAEHDRRVARAEIVLESLNTDAPDRAQSAWTVALDAGWISLRRPFEILREGSAWCLVSACDDAPQQEFAAAVGDTAELVALPGLTEQLAVADTRALTLPPVLVKRMGLGTIDPAQLSSTAQRRGSDFPARFVVEHGSPVDADPSEADMTTGGGPFVRAELLVSRRCRLQALKVELARTGVSSAGGTHRFSWSFDPLP